MFCLKNFSRISLNPPRRIDRLVNLHKQCCSVKFYRLSSSATPEKNDKPNLLKVYQGSLARQIKSVKVFSLSTSIAGLAAQPILIDQATKMGGGTGIIIAVCGFVGFFTFVTPLLLHFVTKKYVTELHYNATNNEYIATIITFFLTKKQISFKVEEVTVPEVPGMFTSFLVRDIPLFVDPKLFEDPHHYVKIMGYDKPMNFKLNLDEEDHKDGKK